MKRSKIMIRIKDVKIILCNFCVRVPIFFSPSFMNQELSPWSHRLNGPLPRTVMDSCSNLCDSTAFTKATDLARYCLPLQGKSYEATVLAWYALRVLSSTKLEDEAVAQRNIKTPTNSILCVSVLFLPMRADTSSSWIIHNLHRLSGWYNSQFIKFIEILHKLKRRIAAPTCNPTKPTPIISSH